jgi:hypothetical protein
MSFLKLGGGRLKIDKKVKNSNGEAFNEANLFLENGLDVMLFKKSGINWKSIQRSKFVPGKWWKWKSIQRSTW